MNSSTLHKLKHLKFFGMHDAFKSIIETGKFDGYTSDQLISYLVEAEWDDRQNRRIARAIKYARFRYKAQMENIIFSDQREINPDRIRRLMYSLQEARE